MYGKTVHIGRFEVFVYGSPMETDDVFIKRAREMLITEITKSEGKC